MIDCHAVGRGKVVAQREAGAVRSTAGDPAVRWFGGEKRAVGGEGPVVRGGDPVALGRERPLRSRIDVDGGDMCAKDLGDDEFGGRPKQDAVCTPGRSRGDNNIQVPARGGPRF